MDSSSSPVAVSDNNHTVQFDSPAHMGAVLSRLHSLRNKEEVDVILNVEGKSFEAHRAVLASCSDYFRAMFTTEFRESREKEVTLEGVSATGIDLLLEYAYTARLSLNSANIQDVLSTASHVQVLPVVEACSSYLQSHLDLKNCVDILNLAETFSLHQLKKRAYCFISGHLMEFSQTPDFQRLPLVQLDYLLNCDYPVDCPESDVLQIVLQWINFNSGMPLSHTLLNRIRYNEIDRDILKIIPGNTLQSWISSQSQELYKSITLHTLGEPTVNTISSPNKEISSLVNSRGMELAIIKVGGFGRSGVTNEITYFLPSIGVWKHLSTIPIAGQYSFGIALLKNHIYVVGGQFLVNFEERIRPCGYRFNPLFAKWSAMAPMRKQRCKFTLNVVGDELYAIGGRKVDRSEGRHCERYEPKSNSWHVVSPLPTAKVDHAGSSWKNLLFICGGLEGSPNIVSRSLLCYKTDLQVWQTKAPMLTPRAGHTMVMYKDMLYVCGGWEDETTGIPRLVTTIDAYDILHDRWIVVTEIPTPRDQAGITIVQEKLYIIGGHPMDKISTAVLGLIECYNLETKHWLPNERYPCDIYGHLCTTLYISKCREDMDVLPDNQ